MQNVINSWLPPPAPPQYLSACKAWSLYSKPFLRYLGKSSQISTLITHIIFIPQHRVNADKLTPTRANYHKNFRALAAAVPEIWMEDPETSQVSSSDTLSLGRNRGPIWDPLIFNPNISPILGATPFTRVQARRPQLDLSIPPPFPLYSLPFRGCGPKIWSKMGDQLQN